MESHDHRAIAHTALAIGTKAIETEAQRPCYARAVHPELAALEWVEIHVQRGEQEVGHAIDSSPARIKIR